MICILKIACIIGMANAYGIVYADDLLRIEVDFNNPANKTYVSAASIDGRNNATASTTMPWLGGAELMKIDYKPNGIRSSLFTFYYYRDGELEGYYEYTWNAPTNSLDFVKSNERRIGFANSDVISGKEHAANQQEIEAILSKSYQLYSAIKRVQNQKKYHMANKANTADPKSVR